MKIAIFSDIHANWQALEAVLRDCPPTDETLCLGDVVGYGGDPNNASRLRMGKNKWYDFDAIFRRDENVWDHSLLANPLIPGQHVHQCPRQIQSLHQHFTTPVQHPSPHG